MTPCLIAEARAILGESQPEYEGLPVALVVIDLGGKQVVAFRSEWKPSKLELEQLLAGGSVYLTVLGKPHPPVWVEAGEASEKGG